jgi:hypothetical protein
MKRIKFSKKNLVLLFIILFGIFLYVFRLRADYSLSDDSARDILRILGIWQNKEITFIGPPLSLGQYTIRELYFSSLSLYIGLLGLLATRFDPVGAVLPNIILFTASIPIFYLLASILMKNMHKAFVGTALYAFSPLTIVHARFFWNPNLIIPFSVLFWYIWIRYKKSTQGKDRIMIVLAGFIASIIFHLHYAAIIPILILLTLELIKKKWTTPLLCLGGITVGLVPLFIFEIRNEFYLAKTLVYNLQNPVFANGSIVPIQNYLAAVAAPFAALIGLKSGEIPFPVLFTNTSLLVILQIILGSSIAYKIYTLYRRKKNRYLIFVILLSLPLMFSDISGSGPYLRYVFCIYPLLVWLVTETIFQFKLKFVNYVIFMPILFSSISLVFRERSVSKYFIPMTYLEEVGRLISSDRPLGRYNVTQNITGDARAISLRYFVLRDAVVKAQDELQYNDLDTLYVLAEKEEDIYSANRWEFTATSNLRLKEEFNVYELKLFKYQATED